MENGLVQVYYGTGKGKTTAAVGLGVRAIGNDYKVIMIQFLKNDMTGECRILKDLEPYFKVFNFEAKEVCVCILFLSNTNVCIFSLLVK